MNKAKMIPVSMIPAEMIPAKVIPAEMIPVTMTEAKKIPAKMIPANLLHKMTEPAPIGEVSRFLYGRPSTQAVRRWRDRGLLTATGVRVKLRTAKIGGRTFVMPEDLTTFLEALQAPAEPTESNAARNADAAHRAKAADAALVAMGY